MAEFMIEHPNLKPIVKIALLPALAVGTIAINISPVENMAMAGLLVLVAVAVAASVAKRRGRDLGHA